MERLEAEVDRGEEIAAAARDDSRVTGLTHAFYRYPAGFSPKFARAVIEAFTVPGEIVFDPFMGGGTGLVEARALGRSAAGTDINSLAVFASKVKTAILTHKDFGCLTEWGRDLENELTLGRSSQQSSGDELYDCHYYQRHLSYRHNYRLRQLLEISLSRLPRLDNDRQRQFARCLLLRTGQWALDCRRNPPTVQAFRARLLSFLTEMIAGALEFSEAVYRSWNKVGSKRRSALCLHRSAEGIEADRRIRGLLPPKLILTSPPYPGVHVLYHRWQVDSRRETPAPYWLSGTLDGNPSSYYTFCDRNYKGLEPYYTQLRRCFASIRAISDRRTVVVQMVAFSEPRWQLPKYLAVMNDAGFTEVNLSTRSLSPHRVWRDVPNRKWYAYRAHRQKQASEVVLVHRPH